MSVFKQATLGVITSQGFLILGISAQIFSTPIILRHLSADAYAVNILITQLYTYLYLLDFGLGQAVARKVAITFNASQYYHSRIASTMIFFLSCVAVLILLLAYPTSHWFFEFVSIEESLLKEAQIVIFSSMCMVALQMPMRINAIFLFAGQKQAFSHVLNMSTGLITPFLILLFVTNGSGLYSFLYTNLIIFLINLGLNLYAFKFSLSNLQVKFSLIKYKSLIFLLKDGGMISIVTLAGILVYQTDRIMTGIILSTQMVTYFSLTIRAPELVFRLINQIQNNFYPGMLSKKDDPEFKHYFIAYFSILNSICFIAYFLILIFNEYFITIWVGQDYYLGNTLLVYYSTFLLLFSLNLSNSIIIHAHNLLKKLAIYSIIEASINISLTIILGKILGAEGIVLGSLVASSLLIYYFPYKVIKTLSISAKKYVSVIFYPFIINLTVYIFIVTVISVTGNDKLYHLEGFILASLLATVMFLLINILLNKHIKKILLPKVWNMLKT